MSKKLERFLRKLGPMKYQCLTMVQETISWSQQVGNTTRAFNMEARRIHGSREILATQTPSVLTVLTKDAADEFSVPGAENIIVTGEEDTNTEYIEAASVC